MAGEDEVAGRGDTARPLRITMACARYPPFVGGTETHVAAVAAGLARRGHQVTVVTTVLQGTGSIDVDDCITVRRVRAWPGDSDLHVAPGLARAITQSRPDVVHLQGYHRMVAPFALHTARRLKRPYVVTFHSGGHTSRFRRALRPAQYRLLRHFLAGAARLIGVSEYETEYFRSRLRVPAELFETLSNGVDAAFLEVDRPFRSTSTIVSPGRLERYKGHGDVVEALHAVRRAIPDAELLIVGGGVMQREFTERAAALGVAEHVRFTSLPHTDRAGMAEALAGAAAVALASRYESQGIVGLEAIATGANVVALDGTALSELGRYPGVELVPSAAVATLAPALIRAMTSERPSERPPVPTWHEIGERLEQIYSDAAGGPHAERLNVRGKVIGQTSGQADHEERGVRLT